MNLKSSKILVTGGAGFMSHALLDLLVSKEPRDIVVMDSITYAANTSTIKKHNIKLHHIDICSEAAKELINSYKPNIILHLAAESHVDNSIRIPSAFTRTNVLGTANLLDGILKLKSFDLFHQVSTDEVTGSMKPGQYAKEDFPRITSSPYSASKASGELFIEAYHTTYGIPYIITRSCNNYGPWQHKEKFIPKAIDSLLRDKPIEVYGNGTNQREWIHTRDNAEGLVFVLENCPTNQIYNIGTYDIVSNNYIANELCNLLGKDPSAYIKYVVDRLGHDTRYAMDSSKLRLLGWKPNIMFQDGLKETIEWYKGRI